jgi:ferredoxin
MPGFDEKGSSLGLSSSMEAGIPLTTPAGISTIRQSLGFAGLPALRGYRSTGSRLRRLSSMTHVVAEPCFGCKYTDCVVVCPVECFYEGEKILYIHPEECIDCEACVPECPVEAIFHQDNVPEEWKDFTALNAEMAPTCPSITEKKKPLVDE